MGERLINQNMIYLYLPKVINLKNGHARRYFYQDLLI